MRITQGDKVSIRTNKAEGWAVGAVTIDLGQRWLWQTVWQAVWQDVWMCTVTNTPLAWRPTPGEGVRQKTIPSM